MNILELNEKMLEVNHKCSIIEKQLEELEESYD